MGFNGYFDNAATSFPKPRAVSREVVRYLDEVGGPYGRSAHSRAVEVSRTVEETRERIANLLGAKKVGSIAFTPNATYAINIALQGMLAGGGHVLVSPLEHNAVMRPLCALRARNGVSFDILPHLGDGLVDVEGIKRCLSDGTRLVVINHQSNVNGVVQPIEEIKQEMGSVPILVDACQSLGHVEMRVDEWEIDYLAFTGHKGLLGPTGTGGLFAREPDSLRPLVYGGTGSRSDSFEMPSFSPDKFEAGTLDIAGIFGLLGALEDRPGPGHTPEDFRWLCSQVRRLPGITFLGATDPGHQGAVFSISHCSCDCSTIAARLDEDFGIETRAGLHCAPLAHRTIGTFPEGTVRIAPSVCHRRSDFEFLVEALAEVSRR